MIVAPTSGRVMSPVWLTKIILLKLTREAGVESTYSFAVMTSTPPLYANVTFVTRGADVSFVSETKIWFCAEFKFRAIS